MGSAILGTRWYNGTAFNPYADPELHNAQLHRQTDMWTDRLTNTMGKKLHT